MFNAVLHVLRTRCAWQALPAELGSVSTTHRHFRRWEQQGLFEAIWAAGLAEHLELQGVHWQCQADGNEGAVRWRPVSGALRGRPRKAVRDVREAGVQATGGGTSHALVQALQRFISRRG
ncbi:MAG: hypothetical protein GAK31_03562 [Stenotrophomonas maltophilia]|uniref:Insertion element IS402-like domain-containing protein n=1 Tax=Stenotrophomonas maltophilia TaxID=40324 RepID=A0A7V8JKH7_STEMA|nr:MAG: hypothetical protein GAK31_03562 [Stenotrophomonas maltophilia]